MQKIQIIGHLGNDAEVKDLNNNQVINFSVAVSESYTNKQTNEKVTNTIWFECAKWGNNIQVAQYLKKGQQVFIEGKVNNRAYLKDDNSVQVVNGINVFDIQLLGSKDSNNNQQNNNQAPTTQTQTNPNEMAKEFNNDEEDSDLPFN